MAGSGGSAPAPCGRPGGRRCPAAPAGQGPPPAQRAAKPPRAPSPTAPRLGGWALRQTRTGLLLLALLLATGVAQAAFLPGDRLADPTAEARAQMVGREVRCMVCQGQSIEDSDADLARDLRRLIRERMAVGDSDPQIRGFLQHRYGDFILLRPPFSVATALLWATPAIALLLGLLLVRRRRAMAGPMPLTPDELAQLDRLAKGP